MSAFVQKLLCCSDCESVIGFCCICNNRFYDGNDIDCNDGEHVHLECLEREPEADKMQQELDEDDRITHIKKDDEATGD